MVTVVIVDDHPIVRTGMRTVLDAAADVTVVAEGTTGDDALCLVEQHCPDVLVLDVNLPDMNGLDVVRCLHDQGTTTAILVLMMHADSHTFFGLLKAGVAGYVLKDEAPESLASAVQAVAQGQNWFSPAVSRQVMRRAVGQTPSFPELLTPREMGVGIPLEQYPLLSVGPVSDNAAGAGKDDLLVADAGAKPRHIVRC